VDEGRDTVLQFVAVVMIKSSINLVVCTDGREIIVGVGVGHRICMDL